VYNRLQYLGGDEEGTLILKRPGTIQNTANYNDTYKHIITNTVNGMFINQMTEHKRINTKKEMTRSKSVL